MFANKIEYKTDVQILQMRESALVTIAGLDAAVAAVKPGVTSLQVDEVFAQQLHRQGAVSNFLGYHGYPRSTCISVNDEIVHAIPSGRVLEAGDILSIDAGCVVQGWHSDSARTVLVGGEGVASAADVKLSAATRGALWAGIAAFASAKCVGDIGAAVEDYVDGLGEDLVIVEDFVGHGIGRQMHQSPDVFNYRVRGATAKVKPGMVLAIEPMLVWGGSGVTKVLADGWTVVSADGARAAQWEHTVALHSGGVWVLTESDGGLQGLADFGVVPVPLG